MDAITASGKMELEKADVNWMLSIDEMALPQSVKVSGKKVYRSLTVNGEMLEFSEGNEGLHIKSYQDILNGNGISMLETRNVIDLVSKMRK